MEMWPFIMQPLIIISGYEGFMQLQPSSGRMVVLMVDGLQNLVNDEAHN